AVPLSAEHCDTRRRAHLPAALHRLPWSRARQEHRRPHAEIILMGVEGPRCLIHAPNESVDPSEIEHMAHVEALFLREFAKARRH
ncbi:hypothetical protein AB0I50_49825, partial [Streptomyces prunicolor]